MRIALFVAVVLVSGCSTVKVNKAYDEGYANALSQMTKEIESARLVILEQTGRGDSYRDSLGTCQQKLQDCYEADKNK